MASRSAFILGYTGETGKALVKELAKEDYFNKIVLVGRRDVELPVKNEDKKFVQKTVDYDNIEKYEEVFQGCEVGYCCLGTTRGKAGAAGFVKVDRDYVANAAKVAKKTGCKHFQLVTANGSNINSSFLYMKTKGEVEKLVKDIQFPRLTILKPGLLLCDREERRIGEAIFRTLAKPFAMLFPTTGSVSVETVAKAMIVATKESSEEQVVELDNANIHKTAKRYKPS